MNEFVPVDVDGARLVDPMSPKREATEMSYKAAAMIASVTPGAIAAIVLGAELHALHVDVCGPGVQGWVMEHLGGCYVEYRDGDVLFVFRAATLVPHRAAYRFADKWFTLRSGPYLQPIANDPGTLPDQSEQAAELIRLLEARG